ncbi:MAG: hypothetical protein AAFV71_22340 [Cyanobacteria bacterium J06633_8]
MSVAISLSTTNCAESLGKATLNILHNAFYLAKQKVELSRKAYKQLIKEWGWEKEDKKYLKVAQTFKKFSPQDLAQIEPATIFLLANQNKKYAPVIEQILDIGNITQEKVRELIKQQRKPKPIKPEKPSIWRCTKNGGRYCQVPPIHEEETGVALQRMMDEEGLTAQQIVAEAIALRKALKEGRLVEVSETPQPEYTDETLNQENQQVQYQDNYDEKTVVEIDNSSEDYSLYSDEIIVNPTTITETVEFLSNELLSVLENIKYFGRKESKEAKQLIAQIIDFCNSQPVNEQWNALAQITRRSSKALMIVIGYSGKEHKDWFFSLPQLLANAALDNPQELEWVDKRLRSEALLVISNITDFPLHK